MSEILNGPKILPANNNKVKNAVVFLHGYGANGNDLVNIGYHWKENFKNTVFISPNAPFRCEWGGESYQWFDLTSTAPEKIGQGLKNAGPFLNEFIEDTKKKFSLDDNNIIFFGFSQGAMMALHHLCKREKECGGVLSYSGLLYENDNFENEIKSRFPIKIFHGKNDEVIDAQYSIKAFERLKKLGFNIEVKLQDGLGHGIDENGLNYGLKFIKSIIKV